jgi:8-oxo-dGTP pyrophosphatase MutT (NUDIX family)
MEFFAPKRLSCGVVIVNAAHELLLCHVTGQNHWDLPKGGINPGEIPLQAALRETSEETGLRLMASELVDLGRFAYTHKKDLHLFAACTARFDISTLHCESHFAERYSGKLLPEMDAFGWFAFARVATLCTPKMALVLADKLDLAQLLRALGTSAQQPAALAA